VQEGWNESFLQGSFRETCMKTIPLAFFLLSLPAWATQNDPCDASSSVSDVQFVLALKGERMVFQEGEIIPLTLSFTANTEKRYWADVRNYDRSGRLGIELYCVEPEVPDPLESYFKAGGFIGGGLGTTQALSKTPFIAEAELNEWRSPGPGHYRVYAVSYRVWRTPDPGEQTPYGQISETLRSNSVEFEVRPASPQWRSEQLRNATQTLAGQSPGDDMRQAARRLRFLNTKDSTRQLAKLFWGLNQQQPIGWDLMFGLYGSPYRQLAIDSMREELSAPDHAITSEFLQTLVELQVTADRSWDPPSNGQGAEGFWQRRQAHVRELTRAEAQAVIAALSQKKGSALAVTVHGLLMAGGDTPEQAQMIRRALVAAWKDLPSETQQDLIEYRWSLIAGPDMLPILRAMLAGPPPPARTMPAMARDAALQHVHEIDPAEGRALIFRDLQNVHVQPSLEVVALLPPEDIAVAVKLAVERIAKQDARELDYVLVDRYADLSALLAVQTAFEEHLGQWACASQSAMLRYFLRVNPAYGAREVSQSLSLRKQTHCYSQLLQGLGDQLPAAQESAIAALNDPDPEVVQDAVLALRRWGSAEAEAALWARLERFHQEWAGREDQIRMTPEYQSPGSRAAALEQGLIFAIASGSSWICPPDKLARLAGLALTTEQRQQIENWIEQWKLGPTLITPIYFPENKPTFSVLQYAALTEDQLRAKLGQFLRGTRLLWQFWPPGEISPPVSMEKQQAIYERVRAAAEKNGVELGQANHP
jgi:hypothetical protein